MTMRVPEVTARVPRQARQLKSDSLLPKMLHFAAIRLPYARF